MKPTVSNITEIQFHRGRPQLDIPRRKPETIDINEVDGVRYEITQKNEEKRTEVERTRNEPLMVTKSSTSTGSDSTSFEFY